VAECIRLSCGSLLDHDRTNMWGTEAVCYSSLKTPSPFNPIHTNA